MPVVWALRGTLVQAPKIGCIDLLHDSFLVVKSGKIVEIGSGRDQDDLCAQHDLAASSVVHLEVQARWVVITSKRKVRKVQFICRQANFSVQVSLTFMSMRPRYAATSSQSISPSPDP